MNKIIIGLIGIAFSNITLANSVYIYKYTDEKGNLIYSDNIPANNKKDYDLLSPKSGVLKKTVAKELTEEEVVIKNVEAKKVEEEVKSTDAQRRQDTALLSTYSNVSEIDKIKEFELTQIQSVIKSDTDSIINLKDKINQYETNAQLKENKDYQENYNRLLTDLSSANGSLDKNKELLNTRSKKYENDKKRYQEILNTMAKPIN